MEAGSTIIGAIILAICSVPFIIMIRKRKKIGREALQAIVNLAKQHDSQISKHEVCGDFIIGIDESEKRVFFLKQREDNTVEHCINLADIQSCKARNTTRSVGGKGNSYSVTDKIELAFTPVDKSKNEIALDFFNADNCIQLAGELQSAEKWGKLISDGLKFKGL